MDAVVGMAPVYIGNVERALIAYRRNSAEQEENLAGLRQKLINSYWNDAWRLLRRFRRWRTGEEPTDSQKVLSYSGGDSWSPMTAAFSSEMESVMPVAREVLSDEDHQLFWAWYIGREKEEYKAVMTLWENTQGDTILLSEVGCRFVNKWSEKYE